MYKNYNVTNWFCKLRLITFDVPNRKNTLDYFCNFLWCLDGPLVLVVIVLDLVGVVELPVVEDAEDVFSGAVNVPAHVGPFLNLAGYFEMV